MPSDVRFELAEVEQRVCDVVSYELGISRNRLSPTVRLVEDLHCDSVDLVELIVTLEETFRVTLPGKAPNSVYKVVFTRSPFRLADLAELIYLQQGTGAPKRRHRWQEPIAKPVPVPAVPFSQLGGVCKMLSADQRLLEPLAPGGPVPQFRRRTDGMRCLLIPAASVEIGCNTSEAWHDEQPKHVVAFDAFLIDAEPVSTTAYCRFLNSVAPVDPAHHAEWFILDPQDDRNEHMLIAQTAQGWQPVPGTERWPMILVSWYGANAYSLWANGQDWTRYRDENGLVDGSFLPAEAQWEYAARGAHVQAFPWGNESPSHGRMRYAQHRRLVSYRADTLPMADVNEQLGMSPFGLHHMAGNVWQWCRDWYDDAFYQKAEARERNPVNRTPSKARSERGGSWIGSEELCRSSYRRGRPPIARGRCLGFRCVSSTKYTE